MATNYAICLLGAMDRLWFHQIILFSEPSSLLFPKPPKETVSTPQPLAYSSSSNSKPTIVIRDKEIPSVTSAILLPDQGDHNIEDREDSKERPTRLSDFTDLSPITSKTRSSSSSPSTQKRSRKFRHSGAVTRLQKTMSCKSLWELELEEVHGFMDLGFIFKKENITSRMMSVVPGLQRLGGIKDEQKTLDIDGNEADNYDDIEEEEEEEDGEERGVMRPYLSEAWLIRRPDSPLLNFRIPRVTTAAEMKKHIRYWARTVASVIQQES
ncbi:unnamed protein product [Ilex paraguariensis]|uniref:Uncharacterized protein n=1 Tax=Ilex paraguariensis TaxID=185542 RepID=A0ABC8UEZ6_9AQUA